MKKGICLLAAFGVLMGVGGCQGRAAQSPPAAAAPLSTPAPAPTPTPGPSPAFVPHTYEVTARVCDALPEYRFAASGLTEGKYEWAYGYITGLNVYDETGAVLLSADFTVDRSEEQPGNAVYNQMMDTMGLHVVDVNFDGYRDVIVLESFGGAHGNSWYHCWLWDPETSAFAACPSFAEICNPALDAEKQCIYSAGGAGADVWGGSIYKFSGGEFVMTNNLEAHSRGLVETALVDGQTQVVREVSLDGEEQSTAREQEYYRNSALWQLGHPRWYMVGGHHADQWLE